MEREVLIELIKKEKLIAIMRGVYGEDAVRSAEALAKGGIRLMEVPFDQSMGDILYPTTRSRTRRAC